MLVENDIEGAMDAFRKEADAFLAANPDIVKIEVLLPRFCGPLMGKWLPVSMLKKLADNGLIKYEPYYGVSLLPKGKKIALNIIRKHRVLEQFLVEKLGYSWDEVDAEAEILEHAISDKFTDRMWESLGKPLRDPHGSPIPDKNGEIILEDVVSLVDYPEKTTAEVRRIQNRSPEELRYFSSID